MNSFFLHIALIKCLWVPGLMCWELDLQKGAASSLDRGNAQRGSQTGAAGEWRFLNTATEAWIAPFTQRPKELQYSKSAVHSF